MFYTGNQLRVKHTCGRQLSSTEPVKQLEGPTFHAEYHNHPPHPLKAKDHFCSFSPGQMLLGPKRMNVLSLLALCGGPSLNFALLSS